LRAVERDAVAVLAGRSKSVATRLLALWFGRRA
jgi:hypothetical protein